MRKTAPPRLVLASASPARLRTLQAAGIDAEVIVSGVDESVVSADRPDALCGALARMKALAVADQLRKTGRRTTAPAGPSPAEGDTLILGCDSVLAFDGRILGKPADPAEAVRRWRRMRGRAGVLYTGHCVVKVPTKDLASPTAGEELGATAGYGGQPRIADEVAATTVRFADVSDAEIDAYVATGEPLHVAGAFTIDGIGGPFVEGIDGDPGTVIGLSLPLLRHLLAKLDVPIYSLWRATTRAGADETPTG